MPVAWMLEMLLRDSCGDGVWCMVYARSVVTAHTPSNVPTQRSPATPSPVMPHLALGFPPRAPP